jgi:hypothetical protein
MMNFMLRRRLAPAVLFLTTPLLAQVTVRYSRDLKFGAAVPAAVTAQFGNPGLGALDGPSVVQIKGDKAYFNAGKFSFITDFAADQVTYIDSENQRFATVPTGELASAMQSAMPQLPPEAAGLSDKVQADLKTRKTGRSETIRGIRADEYELVFAMNLSLPNLPAGNSPALRMVMQFWRANAEDAAANPGLSEFMRFSIRDGSFMNSADFLRKVIGPLQSLGQSIVALQEELKKDQSPILRIHMEEFSPMLAALAPSAGPEQPLITFDQELVEFSTAPVEDTVFQAPSGFRGVALREILSDQFARVR